MNSPKLSLGTVQFGLDYGISNHAGQTSREEAHKILNVAREHGIRTLDTAPSYGNAEQVIGQYPGVAQYFDIVTKAPAFSAAQLTQQHAAQLKSAVLQSARTLNVDSLYGLLLHQCDDLFKPGGERLYQTLLQLKASGKIHKIGVSVYDKAQITRVLANYEIDLIQLPFNILDQRLLLDGTLAELKQQQIEIHARSIFLQGLFFASFTALPAFFAPLEQAVKQLTQYANAQKLSLLELTLGFVNSQEHIDKMICGVNNCQQLMQLSAASKLHINTAATRQFALQDEKLLSPVNWPQA